jgi:beta-lactamase regulating signal transducer with metallopeptidase domain
MNLIESMLSAEFIRAFAWTLFHSLWQVGFLALVAAGLQSILRKYRPATRYAMLYFLMLLIPVFFAGTFLLTYNPDMNEAMNRAEVSGALMQMDNDLVGGLQAVSGTEIPQSWYINTVHLFENQAKWMVLLWFAGFFIFLLRFSGSMLYVYRLKNYQNCQVDEYWNDKLRKLTGKIGMHKPVKLAESALARIPMTIGYLKPVILLPLGTLSGVPPQQIEAILLHELAHILRKDYLLNIIQSVIELLFFYHPVTWWLSGLIREEREHICDDLAVAVNHDHINYIKALTTMEELNVKSPLLASAMTGSKKKLLYRVKRLLSPVKLSKGFSTGIIAFILLVGLILTLSLNALSFIPDAYDLTGRESGERIYSIMPIHNNAQSAASTAVKVNHRPEAENSIQPVTPDTIIAKSKSGKVTISVYTDSTSQLQQEQLDRMAESMEKQAQQFDKASEEYRIQVKKFDKAKCDIDKECKVVVIRKSDSSCTVPPHAPQFRYYYSNPDLHDLEDCREKLFSFDIDSVNGMEAIDTLIFMGPGACMKLDEIEGIEWHADEMDEQMKKNQIYIEREYRNAGNPPFPPPGEQMREFNYQLETAPAERIIRQELIDDGLATPRKKYVIDLDSHGMYINGEKQSKDTYRKYKHLLESLEVTDLENDGTYRLIF